jgi:hypothetical protein
MRNSSLFTAGAHSQFQKLRGLDLIIMMRFEFWDWFEQLQRCRRRKSQTALVRCSEKSDSGERMARTFSRRDAVAHGQSKTSPGSLLRFCSVMHQRG